MNPLIPQCENLPQQVDRLLELLHQEGGVLRNQDVSAVRASLKKAISPRFEIVFAGAFSAGKSMLINALLERELLYSAEGHATGTECYISYAEPSQERVVLTFLSEAEIRQQTEALCGLLKLSKIDNINDAEALKLLRQQAQVILELEGGESRSERAKQAKALDLLLEGFVVNRDRIQTVNNATYSMEQFNTSNIEEAARYARRSNNSAVLKRIEYYCYHPLLQDGNVIIDTPGIDAPVKRDAQLAYDKIEHPDTSAVVCVFKTAATGELTTEETELIERMQGNSGIRDRVFYIFNRIDETWYNDQLRKRLEYHISTQFRDTQRVFKTSGLLGFYGSQIKKTNNSDRWGLNSIFAESIKGLDGKEETPQFVNEFNRYCLTSDKLSPSRFSIPPSVLISDSRNDKYVLILNSLGMPLIEQLIQDSGVEDFQKAITRYLTQEKRPQLFENLADDLQSLCIQLRESYLEAWRELDSQPREIDALKEQKMRQLGNELKQIGDEFRQHIEQELNTISASNDNALFETDFGRLQKRMVSRLDELLNTLSVGEIHKRAQASHKRNSVVPLLGILAEAFYYLSNELEDVLVESSEEIVENFFLQLGDHVRKSSYYGQLYRLLGNDGGIEQTLNCLRDKVKEAVSNEAKTECDRYVRERPDFYTEGTVSIFQLRQTLQQACRGYDYQSMIEAEPAIRQLLKLDFEQKILETVMRTFRQTINQTLNSHLLKGASQQAELILQHYDTARAYLAQTLEKEAAEKIKSNLELQDKIEEKIWVYNDCLESVNSCLKAMLLDRKVLPVIKESELRVTSLFADINNSVTDAEEELTVL